MALKTLDLWSLAQFILKNVEPSLQLFCFSYSYHRPTKDFLSEAACLG